MKETLKPFAIFVFWLVIFESGIQIIDKFVIPPEKQSYSQIEKSGVTCHMDKTDSDGMLFRIVAPAVESVDEKGNVTDYGEDKIIQNPYLDKLKITYKVNGEKVALTTSHFRVHQADTKRVVFANTDDAAKHKNNTYVVLYSW